MRKCELCKFPARSYCESDQASLCWDCDAKVHAANFLVARHSRTLLCHSCQSLTPWKASGAKLGRTVSVCHRCANQPNNGRRRHQHQHEEQHQQSENTANDDVDDDDDDGDVDVDGDADDDDEEEEEEDNEGDGDNQVVPWSSTATPPPGGSSSSCSSSSSSTSSEDCPTIFDSVNVVVSLKRRRQSFTDLRSFLQENINRSSSQKKYGRSPELTAQAGGGYGVGGGDACVVDCDGSYALRPLKDRRTESGRAVQSGSRSAAIVEGFNQTNYSNDEFSGESETVDVDLSGNTNRTI